MRNTMEQRGPGIWRGATGASFVALVWVLIRHRLPGVAAHGAPSRAARLLSEGDHACRLGDRSRR